ALRLLAVLLEAQIEHLGASHRRTQRCVGVHADEQIRFVVVRNRCTLIQTDSLIPLAREDDADPETPFERSLQFPCNGHRDVLLERPAGSACAVLIAAVPRVDDDRPHAGRCEISQRRWLFGWLCGLWWCWRCFGGLRDDINDDPA